MLLPSTCQVALTELIHPITRSLIHAMPAWLAHQLVFGSKHGSLWWALLWHSIHLSELLLPQYSLSHVRYQFALVYLLLFGLISLAGLAGDVYWLVSISQCGTWLKVIQIQICKLQALGHLLGRLLRWMLLYLTMHVWGLPYIANRLLVEDVGVMALTDRCCTLWVPEDLLWLIMRHLLHVLQLILVPRHLATIVRHQLIDRLVLIAGRLFAENRSCLLGTLLIALRV